MKPILKPLACISCKHEWYPRLRDRKPKVCPNCKRTDYARKPKESK